MSKRQYFKRYLMWRVVQNTLISYSCVVFGKCGRAFGKTVKVAVTKGSSHFFYKECVDTQWTLTTSLAHLLVFGIILTPIFFFSSLFCSSVSAAKVIYH
jgi:hypothetical protein